VTWVIAHRGASWDETENTLPAFERAIAVDADFVEFDVQAASDGALVVFHDVELDRLTPLSGPLRYRPLAELREVGIPTLDDVLELCTGRIGVMAELKSPHLYRRHDIVARTVARLPREAIVISFSRPALLEAHRARPKLRLLQHVGFGTSIATAAGYSWGVGFQDARVTERGFAKATVLGLATAVYTVNDPARMRELEALGVDGVFTDCPDRALQSLARPRPSA
jgi:glycerophosphoryl diester phosphodiesterase